MIPGDIDLTQNLDFRKTVKKKIPKFPVNWKRKKEMKVSNNISYTNASTGIDRIDDNITLSVYYSDIEDLYNMDIIYDTIDMWTMNDSNSSSINFNYYNINDHGFYDGYSTYTVGNTSSASMTSYRIQTTNRFKRNNPFKVEDEYDVFGNKKNRKKEYIPSIPWRTTKSTENIPSIPWESYETRKSYYGYFDDFHRSTNKRIPWTYIKPKRPYNLEDTAPRAQCLISWLKDKSYRFIKNYLDRDNDADLSYLTNMGWIHVKDAVID